MKTGIEYASSSQKRAIDLGIATLLTPLSWSVQAAAALSMHHAGLWEYSSKFTQTRIGMNEQPFDIYKIRTLRPDSDEMPYSALAALLRKFGLDETAQAKNIRLGAMSAAGFRPLIPEENERSMDLMGARHQRMQRAVFQYTKPGFVSSFALHYHSHPEADPNFDEMRAELNYRDFIAEGSPRRDIQIFGSFIGLALSSRLK